MKNREDLQRDSGRRPRRRSAREALVLAKVRRRRALGKQRGVALILVLGALTILTVMLTESQDESSADFASALATRDQLIAEYAAKSGVNLSRLLIATEPTIRTAMAPILMLLMRGPPPQIPVWEHASRVLGAFNDSTGAAEFASLSGMDTKNGQNLGFDGAGFELDIIDEDAKIDINVPAQANSFSKQRLGQQLAGLFAGPQYDPLFTGHDADGQFSDRLSICGAIIDFIDPDQDSDQSFCDPTNTTAQANGAEDGFYQSLKRPYERKNAALDSFEELHRVRGMSEDFWSTFIDPDPDEPRKRVITVWGQGKVNVNSANPQTVLALVCSNVDPQATMMCHDPTEAMKFLSAFSMVRMFTRGAPLFGTPDMFVKSMAGKGMFGNVLAALGIQPVIFKSDKFLTDQISTESKVFSIYATGHVQSGSRTTQTKIHAVVDFRAAPPPGMDTRTLATANLMQNQMNQMNQANQPTGTTGTPDPNATGALGPNAMSPINAVMKPSPGGTILYFRVD
ncbi:MAG TPA: type II secretion system protein GspK [Polyangiaceae bacterium]|nr:type II secretion system protein GspK [Polyangiaceae bacterium]